jgi:hypothetical protein
VCPALHVQFSRLPLDGGEEEFAGQLMQDSDEFEAMLVEYFPAGHDWHCDAP